MDLLHEIGTTFTCPTIALLRDRKMLVGLRNYTADKWKPISVWTTPGGRSNERETIEAALRREVEEETGITHFVITNYLGTVPGANEADAVLVYVGETAEEPELREPEKFSEWRWAPVDALPGEFLNPAVLDLIWRFLLQDENWEYA